MSQRSGFVRRYRDEDRNTVWALSQIPHIGATADPSARLDMSRDDPGPWGDLWDVHASHMASGGDFLVYELDGRVVGMGAVMPDASGTGEINHVRVHPALRRRGIGRAIMIALERRAAELGCMLAHLDTTVAQPEAIAFYRALGYAESGREKLPDWELVFFTKDLARSKTLTLNSGLSVGDPDLAVRHERARADLLERMRAGLASDERVEAVWVHGSLGRGEEDVLSDIDLIVSVAPGADEAFVRSLPLTVAQFAPVAIVNHVPDNAPADGYFVSSVYDVDPLPINCDWSVWPFRPVRPADVRVLFEREPPRFSRRGTYDELMSGAPRAERLLDSSDERASPFFMILPVVKDAVRGWTESVTTMLPYSPFEIEPQPSMEDLISGLIRLVDEHGHEELPSAVAAVRRFLDGAKRLLPVELRAGTREPTVTTRPMTDEDFLLVNSWRTLPELEGFSTEAERGGEVIEIHGEPVGWIDPHPAYAPAWRELLGPSVGDQPWTLDLFVVPDRWNRGIARSAIRLVSERFSPMRPRPWSWMSSVTTWRRGELSWLRAGRSFRQMRTR